VFPSTIPYTYYIKKWPEKQEKIERLFYSDNLRFPLFSLENSLTNEEKTGRLTPRKNSQKNFQNQPINPFAHVTIGQMRTKEAKK